MLFEQPADSEDAVAAAIAAAVSEAADGLEQTWRALTTPQRRVLAAAAEGHHHLHSSMALARTGLGKGGQTSARDALIAASHLAMTGDRAFRVVDPLLAIWILQAPPARPAR